MKGDNDLILVFTQQIFFCTIKNKESTDIHDEPRRRAAGGGGGPREPCELAPVGFGALLGRNWADSQKLAPNERIDWSERRSAVL